VGVVPLDATWGGGNPDVLLTFGWQLSRARGLWRVWYRSALPNANPQRCGTEKMKRATPGYNVQTTLWAREGASPK